MDKAEKVRFIHTLTATVIDRIESQIYDGKIPDEWDGIELRWLLADKFTDCTYSAMRFQTRRRNYKNTVVVNNL